MNKVYLGLGSNLGEREDQIEAAIALMAENPMITIGARSTLMETDAVSQNPQPKYINGAIEIDTILTPHELLAFTQDIEIKLGRQSKGDYSARPIDIDILIYANDIISDDDLVVPHPLMHEREFVLLPLMELIPDWEHPMLGMAISDIYLDMKESSAL